MQQQSGKLMVLQSLILMEVPELYNQTNEPGWISKKPLCQQFAVAGKLSQIVGER